MWWFFRAISFLVSHFLIVLTIPLAFDVGGRECGLAFSLSLAVFYFLQSLLQLATPATSTVRKLVSSFVSAISWFIVLVLLIWSLNKFAVDAPATSWVERTFGGKRAADASIREWIFGRGGLLETSTVGGWDKLLRWSIPVFQIAEGFCSLLVIQALGQVSRWLVNQEHGDSWMIGLLSISASIISTTLYFLWKITTFPEISNVDAILIGAAITCAIFLASWGIVSGRGNPVESSLLFAYITLCVYQIFTDYQSSPDSSVLEQAVSQPALPPLPPIIMASYSTLMHALSTLPMVIHNSFSFVRAAFMTITPSVFVSLFYRTFVLIAAARIIPAIRESGARTLSESPSLDDSDETGRLIAILGVFRTSILVAVYTSLLMQHFAAISGNGHSGEIDWWTTQGGSPGGNLWRWINLAFTMAVYAVELYLGRTDMETGITTHWKTD
ncbi:ER membrane protein-like protein [Microthyrium microscopicum]|uniref:ER membrane protein-like protein n=1 Tax=Microthyrium microscopicum TaxID=703497 RepID=A0A6A6U2H8_9PEZI|nr:ER membrane protein-like protein [Microthyrium microscopicum]